MKLYNLCYTFLYLLFLKKNKSLQIVNSADMKKGIFGVKSMKTDLGGKYSKFEALFSG